MAIFIDIFVILPLIALGIMFLNGKGAFLIAGYNTASKEEKAKTDEKKLCKFMGKLMFVLAACYGIIALSDVFNNMAFFWIGLALFLTVAFGGAIYANVGDKFKKTPE